MARVGRGHRFEIDVDLLRRLYVEEKRSTREIGLIVGCSYDTVSQRLIEHGIPIRDRGEAQKHWVRTEIHKKRISDSHKARREQSNLWRGGISTPGDLHLASAEWKRVRRECYERDRWLCQDCGVHCTGKSGPERIQAHHVIPRSRGGGDDLGNLVTLCTRCHKTREWRHKDCLFL